MSGLPIGQAMVIQAQFTMSFRVENRNQRYYERRRELEQMMRQMFIDNGGKPAIGWPHYMCIGESPFLATWFEDSAFVRIPIEEFDLQTVSFTYGDTFPTFSPRAADGMEYRGKLYFYDEILEIIQKYGLPQDSWDGTYASPCYVEAQVWSDMPIGRYR
ncbi:MAG: hypothetical protein FWC78_03455 [Defluviitaleaceae bacterium]|nr:hypothetical protein [Defluviitaleaceae bacterium]